MRGEPGTSGNETNEMSVKNDIEWHDEEYASNTNKMNIFLEMSKEVPKISRPDNKGFYVIDFCILLLHE